MIRHWLRAAGILAALSLNALFAQQSSMPAGAPASPVIPPVVGLWAVGPTSGDQDLDCAATGFLVNEDGYILTNAHVVERARRCLGQSSGAKILASSPSRGSFAAPAVSCDVIEIDNEHDLAVLKTERAVSKTLGPARDRFVTLDIAEAPVGTPLLVTGFPAFARQPVTQSGRLVRYSILRFFPSEPPSRTIVIDTELRQGSSGSPVYTRSGGVVGIVESRDETGQTVAVPIQYAIQLLKRLKIAWHTTDH